MADVEYLWFQQALFSFTHQLFLWKYDISTSKQQDTRARMPMQNWDQQKLGSHPGGRRDGFTTAIFMAYQVARREFVNHNSPQDNDLIFQEVGSGIETLIHRD